MKDDVADLGKIDELLMTYDLSDEVLEAAARVDGGRAITFGYCATASSAWYCLPYEQAPSKLPSVPRQILKDVPRPPNSASRDD